MPIDLREKFVSDLDWNLLRTFVVIVNERGITAAANRLLLRQPTISLALQRLEAQIGSRLVERGHGVFRLTAAGRELYRECLDIHGNIARLQDMVGSASRRITGAVRIALASHVTTPLLDETLSAFHAAHPEATYEIRIATSADVTRSVQDKSVSFGICLVNKRLPQLEYEVIYREFFGYFCGPSHPLFGKRHLRIEDLRGLSAVSFGTDDLADALQAGGVAATPVRTRSGDHRALRASGGSAPHDHVRSWHRTAADPRDGARRQGWSFVAVATL